MSLVEWLLGLGAQPNAKDTSNRTALHFAARGGHALVVKLLLERGADPFALDYWGQLANHGCSDEVRKILEPDSESWPDIVTKYQDSKYNLFKYYLKDTDLNRLYGDNETTLLYHAAYEGHLDPVQQHQESPL